MSDEGIGAALRKRRRGEEEENCDPDMRNRQSDSQTILRSIYLNGYSSCPCALRETLASAMFLTSYLLPTVEFVVSDWVACVDLAT
jgi:hypothetical protein